MQTELSRKGGLLIVPITLGGTGMIRFSGYGRRNRCATDTDQRTEVTVG